MQPPPVLTKTDFSYRYRLNEFGNHSPTWDTLEEYLQEKPLGLVHLRNRVAGAPTWYDVPADMVETVARGIIDGGIEKASNLYYSLMCPTHRTLFQGEVMRSNRHLDLFYSTIAKPMRASLLEGGKQVHGSTARLLLKHFMCVRSYEWLEHLLDSYEDHVIEFTVLDCKWGTDPRYNTLWWEVRKF